MKIALIRGPYLRPNGVLPWEYIHNHYNDIHVTAFGSIPSRFDISTLEMPIKRLHWLDGKLKRSNKFVIGDALSYLKLPRTTLYGLNKVVKEYDIIHTSENYNFFSLQGAMLAKIHNKKFVFSAGENIPFLPHNMLTWQVKKFVNNTASAITTTTPLGKKALIHEGVQPEKIKVIPNALDFSHFDKKSKKISKIKLPTELEETFNILFVGRLHIQKGIQFLLKAFQELKEEIKDIRLLLVGKNQLEKQFYEAYVKNDKRIYHLNYIPNREIQYMYNLCDVFILPSITMPYNEEQFGMTVLEAMACGKPTIVTNIGGLPYIVEKDKTSIVINERSVSEIKNAIIRLYEDDGLRDRLGCYSYGYVRENFSKEVVGKMLYKFYSDVIYSLP